MCAKELDSWTRKLVTDKMGVSPQELHSPVLRAGRPPADRPLPALSHPFSCPAPKLSISSAALCVQVKPKPYMQKDLFAQQTNTSLHNTHLSALPTRICARRNTAFAHPKILTEAYAFTSRYDPPFNRWVLHASMAGSPNGPSHRDCNCWSPCRGVSHRTGRAPMHTCNNLPSAHVTISHTRTHAHAHAHAWK